MQAIYFLISRATGIVDMSRFEAPKLLDCIHLSLHMIFCIPLAHTFTVVLKHVSVALNYLIVPGLEILYTCMKFLIDGVRIMCFRMKSFRLGICYDAVYIIQQGLRHQSEWKSV